MNYRRRVGVNPPQHRVARALDADVESACCWHLIGAWANRCCRPARVIANDTWTLCVLHARELGYEIPPGVELESGGSA